MAKRVFLDKNYIVVDKDNGSPLLFFQKKISFTKINSTHYQLYGGELNQGDYQTFLITDSANWFAEDGTTSYDSSTLKTFLLENTGSDQTIAESHEVVSNGYTTTMTRPSVYQYEVAGGLRSGKSTVNKFGYNGDLDSASEEIIASFGGSFDPTSQIITTAQTFTVTYNSTTDGLGTTGATQLLFTYLDENFLQQTGVHVLGSDGSDVTTFEGLGINRCLVLANGGLGYNVNDITITATTDTSTQAQIPALGSVTQQALFHTPISNNLYLDWLFVSAGKTSGGSQPKFTVFGYSWSRVTLTRYEIFRSVFDTQRQNFLELKPSQPFVLGGREVLWFEAETDTNNSEIDLRLSGSLETLS